MALLPEKRFIFSHIKNITQVVKRLMDTKNNSWHEFIHGFIHFALNNSLGVLENVISFLRPDLCFAN